MCGGGAEQSALIERFNRTFRCEVLGLHQGISA